jgi:pyrroloquinoline quinone biosynthesis protein B
MKVVVLRGGQAPDALPRRESLQEPAATGRHGALALSDHGAHWALVNVAPNVADQLHEDPSLTCHAGLRDGEARTVLLTDAQVDHLSGLLSLRDGAPIDLYATPAVFELLSQSMPVLQILQHYCGVHWHVIPVAGETLSATFQIESLPDLEFTALATEGCAPPYLQGHELPAATGLSIAIAVRDLRTGQRLFCAPGAQSLGESQLDWLRSADCVLLDDHTTWPEPDLAATASWRAHRRVRLGDQGAVPPGTDQHGFEPAYDGMVIEL